jgi:hypothetical protein
MHGNLATMETDLSLGPAPVVADAASATVMRPADEMPRVLAKHLLDGSDPGRQTEALEGAVAPSGRTAKRWGNRPAGFWIAEN